MWVLTSQWRPHELLLLGYGFLVGVATLVSDHEPDSIMAKVPGWLATLWAIAFIISGIAGIIGHVWRSQIMRSLRLELGGMLVGAGATLLYAFATVSVLHTWQGILGASILGAWTGANLWRAGQIFTDLKRIKAAATGEQA